MRTQRVKFNHSVVSQLRLVFVIISAVLLGSLIINLFQLRTLERASNSLTQSSVPVLAESAALERQLKNLLLLLQDADATSSGKTLLTIEKGIQDIHGLLRNELANIALAVPDHSGIQGVSDAIDTIEVNAARFLNSKRNLLVSGERFDAKIADLRSAHAHAKEILQRLEHDLGHESDPKFENQTTDSTPTPIDLGQLPHVMAPHTTITTELALLIENTFENASNARHISGQDELNLVKEIMNFKLGQSETLVRQLPQSELQSSFAAQLSQINDLIFAKGGLFDTAAEQIDERKKADMLRAEQMGPIRLISDHSRLLTGAAKDQVENAAKTLEESFHGIQFNLIAAGILAISTICLALVYLVERQISKRMAKLTHAVTNIAEGNTTYDVDVSGMDELGKMARSLDVFKTNAEELQRSNIELEKFAYVAAHDLRSPLRAIQDLSEWVVDDPDTSFSEEGREYMALLQQRIDRLNKLLSDLLEYSRVGKEENDIAAISVADITRETAELLDPDGHYNIRFVGDETEAMTYSTPVRHILINLLSNAIKHHDRPTGSIEVRAELFMGLLRCTVKDDGPGIPPEYHERVFNLFQTLRPRDEVEGSGLGLAIIRKLLEHHGGTIRLSSNPETARGASFVFVMPEVSVDMPPMSKAA